MTRLAVALALGLAACGGATPGGGADADDAVVLLECVILDASVWIDGRYIRPLRDLRGGIALEPGTHYLEIKHDDYHTFYAELALRERERRRVVIELAEVLP